MSESNGDDQGQPRQLPQVRRKRGESDHTAVARTVLHPATNAARTAQVFSPVMAPMELDLPSLVDELARPVFRSIAWGHDSTRGPAVFTGAVPGRDLPFPGREGVVEPLLQPGEGRAADAARVQGAGPVKNERRDVGQPEEPETRGLRHPGEHRPERPGEQRGREGNIIGAEQTSGAGP